MPKAIRRAPSLCMKFPVLTASSVNFPDVQWQHQHHECRKAKSVRTLLARSQEPA